MSLTPWLTLYPLKLHKETNWHNKSSSRRFKNKLFCNSPLNPLKLGTKHLFSKFKLFRNKSNPSSKKPIKLTSILQKSISFKHKFYNSRPLRRNLNKDSKHYNWKKNPFLNKSKKSKKPFKNCPKSMNPFKPNCFKSKTNNIKCNSSMNRLSNY